MRKLFYTLGLIASLSPFCRAQEWWQTRTTPVYDKNTVGVAAYNVLFGAVAGGIGGMINRDETETKGRAFWNGALKGSLAGSMCFAGKFYASKIVYQKSYSHAFGARAIHSLGTSMLENTVTNRGLFEILAFDYAFIRIESNTRNHTFTHKIKPFTLGSYFAALNKGKVNIERTFATGVVSYDLKWKDCLNYGGFAIGKAVIVDNVFPQDVYDDFAHELIHTFQYDEHVVISKMINLNKIKTPAIQKIMKSRWINNDFVKNRIYLDAPVFVLPYTLSTLAGRKLNIYEWEADTFGR